MSVAQLAEHRVVVPRVVGSSPTTHPSKILKSLVDFCIVCDTLFIDTKRYTSGRGAIGSALALGARGCQFESGRPDHFFTCHFFCLSMVARYPFSGFLRSMRSFDWVSIWLLVILSSIGLLAVYSATYTADIPCSGFFYKQCLGVITGFLLFFAISCSNYKTLQYWGVSLFVFTTGLLVFTLIKGSMGGWGAQRWINLGFIKFQPSELTKLFFPAFFTYFVNGEDLHRSFKSFIPTLLVLGFSTVLVLKQPDLGTALIILGSGMILLWIANIGRTFFMCATLLGVIGAPVVWNHLHHYQKQRVVVFLGGGSSQKERYQVEQSRIAIGSGGTWGKGFLQGTQNKLNFLPASHTDFIFSVIGEEFGFIGSCLVILLFCLLFLRMLFKISRMPYAPAQLLAMGLIAPVILSTIVNMSMVIGMLPAVGIPLPFITYGITHLWIGFASLGWYNSIVSQVAQLPLGAPIAEIKTADHLLRPPE